MAKASKRQRLIKSSSSEKNAAQDRATVETDLSGAAGYRQSGGRYVPRFCYYLAEPFTVNFARLTALAAKRKTPQARRFASGLA